LSENERKKKKTMIFNHIFQLFFCELDFQLLCASLFLVLKLEASPP